MPRLVHDVQNHRHLKRTNGNGEGSSPPAPTVRKYSTTQPADSMPWPPVRHFLKIKSREWRRGKHLGRATWTTRRARIEGRKGPGRPLALRRFSHLVAPVPAARRTGGPAADLTVRLFVGPCPDRRCHRAGTAARGERPGQTKVHVMHRPERSESTRVRRVHPPPVATSCQGLGQSGGKDRTAANRNSRFRHNGASLRDRVH